MCSFDSPKACCVILTWCDALPGVWVTFYQWEWCEIMFFPYLRARSLPSSLLHLLAFFQKCLSSNFQEHSFNRHLKYCHNFFIGNTSFSEFGHQDSNGTLCPGWQQRGVPEMHFCSALCYRTTVQRGINVRAVYASACKTFLRLKNVFVINEAKHQRAAKMISKTRYVVAGLSEQCGSEARTRFLYRWLNKRNAFTSAFRILKIPQCPS